VELAEQFSGLAAGAWQSGQVGEALRLFDQAVAALEGLPAKDRAVAGTRQVLRDVQCGRAASLDKLGRHAESVRAWDRAIDLDEGTNRPGFRLGRAGAMARGGDHAGAVAEANGIAELKGVGGPLLYDAACVCAVAAAAARGDAPLAGRYATRAVELLGRAREAGHFKDAAMINHAKRDTDLDSLRSRDDFQKFMASLGAEENKGKGHEGK
jgi:hypothetical protein